MVQSIAKQTKKTKRRSRHLEITLLLGYSVHGGLRETQKKGRVEASSFYPIFSPNRLPTTSWNIPSIERKGPFVTKRVGKGEGRVHM